jgi:hypothetical protein
MFVLSAITISFSFTVSSEKRQTKFSKCVLITIKKYCTGTLQLNLLVYFNFYINNNSFTYRGGRIKKSDADIFCPLSTTVSPLAHYSANAQSANGLHE